MLNRRRLLSRLPAVALMPFGVRHDGVTGLFPMTDYGARATASEQTNATAFYRALEASLRAGGAIQVDGRYPVTNLILDGAHRATIVGLGRGRSALIGGTGDNALLSVARSDGVAVRAVELMTDGVAAVYGLSAADLTLAEVQTAGGRMAGVFLDRCHAPVMSHVAVREVLMHSGGVGGCGAWLMRGGNGGRLADITVERVDGDGVRMDASSNDGLPAVQPVGVALMGLYVNSAGRVASNAAALMLEGVRDATVSSVQIAAMRGHGLVMQQDQSGLIPQGNLVSGAVLRNLTGYAVALLGAQDNAVLASAWDGTGVGAVLQSAGLGGSGAPSTGNTVQIARPGR